MKTFKDDSNLWSFGVGEYLEATVMLFYRWENYSKHAVGNPTVSRYDGYLSRICNLEKDGAVVTVDPDDVEIVILL